ncbi:hypothetical protein [Pseudomonas sp. RIT-PI-o]|uniref:hypothetical protein n=1 Tax=Pseudomonas sp. RIT-PI-o TaxID=1690246 RepID=UPI0006CCCCC4|nr:hypothetical protein [Pseudomonas sp. RIT-PI-o]KPG82450.1 hypothetical protein AEQ63_11000 [Pseudomonas sp. RIT-PI-o]
MNTFTTAASDRTRGIPPPGTWQEFQSFCVDAFPLVQHKYSISRRPTANYWVSSGYGKNGDTQNGVDIFDHFSTATMQCKRVVKFTLGHLEKELDALKGYHAPLSAHFIVTSLEETNQTVSTYVAQHNAALEDEAHPGQVPPMLPAVRLPKVYVLNWPEIKAILCTDLFLAWKWGFHLAHPQYHNLNGVDLKTVIGAASTMSCSLPPGGGGKSPRVLDAINVLTQSLDAVAIASLGETEKVASSTFHGMREFLELMAETRDMARRVKPALAQCVSLDGVSKREGLKTLNHVVTFQARIEAYKYLNRLEGMIERLISNLDHEHFFSYGQKELHYEEMSVWDTDESTRYYNFSESDSEIPPWYIPGQPLSHEARFIANEIRKVRVNIKPSNIHFR